MPILDTFFRDGVFVLNEPVTGFAEGELVKITVDVDIEDKEKQRRIELLKKSRRKLGRMIKYQTILKGNLFLHVKFSCQKYDL